MRGTDHIAISMGSGLLLASPWLLSHPLPVALFLGGVIIGSLLPDTDATDSKLHYMDGVARIFSLIMRPVIMPLTGLFYRVAGKKFNPSHRGSMHTVPGVIVYSVILAGVIGSALYLSGYYDPIIAFFLMGLFIGSIFHILEDCCTRSGLMPLKPYSSRKFAGSINTGDRKEKRPGLYAKGLFGASAAVLVGGHHYQIDGMVLIALSAGLFLILWLLICRASRWGP